MSEHTKEPWVVLDLRLASTKKERLTISGFEMDMVVARIENIVSGKPIGDVDEANARRIVACVNACRDIPTEWLEANEIGPHVSMCGLNQMAAEQQRDKLLEALKFAEFTMDDCPYTCDAFKEVIKKSQAIIAEVEASKAPLAKISTQSERMDPHG